MQSDFLLDQEGHRNNLKSGSGTLRIRNPVRQPFEETQMMKPKSTSRKNDFSPYVSLTKRFGDLQMEFDNRTDNSMRREYSTLKGGNTKPPKQESGNLMNQNSFKRSNGESLLKDSRIDSRVGSRVDSRIDTPGFLSQMESIINSHYQHINTRINQFKQNAKQHIQNQYRKFKEAIKAFIDDIFKAAHDTFMQSFEKKLLELNKGFTHVEHQLLTKSKQIKNLMASTVNPGQFPNPKQINQTKIQSDINEISLQSENLNFQTVTINLDRRQLSVIQKGFKQLLNIDT